MSAASVIGVSHTTPRPGCTDIVLEDLFLLNPTRGVEIGGAGGAAGRILVRRIWGQPLTDGIVADGCYDLLWLDNIQQVMGHEQAFLQRHFACANIHTPVDLA